MTSQVYFLPRRASRPGCIDNPLAVDAEHVRWTVLWEKSKQIYTKTFRQVKVTLFPTLFPQWLNELYLSLVQQLFPHGHFGAQNVPHVFNHHGLLLNVTRCKQPKTLQTLGTLDMHPHPRLELTHTLALMFS